MDSLPETWSFQECPLDSTCKYLAPAKYSIITEISMDYGLSPQTISAPALHFIKMHSKIHIMKCSRLYVCLAIALTTCFCDRENSSDPNLIIIGIDTLRADRLGCYGYEKNTSPNIDRLADEGVIFLRNYSQAPWTMPSFASIMTSLYPRTHLSAIRKYEGDEWDRRT